MFGIVSLILKPYIAYRMLRRYIILLSILLIGLVGADAQQVPGFDQRVTGIVSTEYDDDGRIINKDSVNYSYSNNRGSKFNATDYSPSGIAYGYLSNLSPDVSELADIPEPSNDAQKMNVRFDRYSYYKLAPANMAYSMNNTYTANYKGENISRLDRRDNVWPDRVYRRLVERANNGLVLSVTTIDADDADGRWDTVYSRVVSYDNALHIASDTILSRDGQNLSMAYGYVYDQQGRITAIRQWYSRDARNWLYTRQYLLGYDDKGNYTSWIHLQARSPNQPVWDTISKTYWGYDDEQRLVSRNYVNPSGSRVIVSSYNLHYNENGDVDTFSINKDHQLKIIDQVVFHYNEYHNPDSAVVYRINAGRPASSPAIVTRYYYELYNDTLHRPRTEERAAIIYPNPGNGSITIRWNDKKPAIPAYVTLYAANGQMVSKQYIADILPENTVVFTDIASGVYYLRITTQAGGLLHTEALSISAGGR